MASAEAHLQKELSSQKDALLDQMIAYGGEYRQSTLYGMQFLRGPLDLRDIKFTQLITVAQDFDVLMASQQQVKERCVMDSTFMAPSVNESEDSSEDIEQGV